MNKNRVLKCIAMFLYAYVAGTVFFMFIQMQLYGSFNVYHPASHPIPLILELVASGAILGVALWLFIKSFREALS